MPLTLVAPVLAAGAIALATAAAAAEPAKPSKSVATVSPAKQERSGGFGAKATGPLLTREELRACFATQDRVQAKTGEATRLRADLDAQKAELLHSEEALKADRTSVDRTDQTAVDAYNARLVARSQRVAAYEQAIRTFNERVDDLTTEREAFTRNCSNRRYDEADEIALRNGR